MARWTVDDIPWDRFDASKVDPEILRVIKAAAMVEYNGGDYGIYLRNVFHDDEAFKAAAEIWAVEEVQHGLALGRWAEMADLDFKFEDRFKIFTDGYRINLDAKASIRGSRTGELAARCIVETGTSSFYSALRDAAQEPVLKEICRRIAADEFRHYKLFYEHMNRYAAQEGVGKAKRLMIALGRVREADDDELAYAYYAANDHGLLAYDRKRCNRAYAGRAYGHYRPGHVQRAVGMVMKTIGLNPQGRLAGLATRLMWRTLSRRAAAFHSQAA